MLRLYEAVEAASSSNSAPIVKQRTLTQWHTNKMQQGQ